MFDKEDIEELRYQLLKIMQEEPASYRQYAIMIGFPPQGHVVKDFLCNKHDAQIATLMKIKNFIESHKHRACS